MNDSFYIENYFILNYLSVNNKLNEIGILIQRAYHFFTNTHVEGMNLLLPVV